MTKHEARERLAATWRFSRINENWVDENRSDENWVDENRVGENIVLREVALIEAVRDHELTLSITPPLPSAFAGSPRPS